MPATSTPGTYNLIEGSLLQIAPGINNITSNISDAIKLVFVLLIVACIVAAAIMIAIGGLRLTAATSSAEALAVKKDISHAIYGLLGVLGLWLLLNQINPELLRGNLGFTTMTTQNATGTPVSGGTGTPAPSGAKPVTDLALDAVVRNRLKAAGISINKEACTEEQNKQAKPSCTDLDYLPESTIVMLTTLIADCKCSIQVTGGTEKGHSTHGKNGRRAVDLALTDLGNYIRNSPYSKNLGRKVNSSGYGCDEQYLYKGWLFCNETFGPTSTNHWHVDYKG